MQKKREGMKTLKADLIQDTMKCKEREEEAEKNEIEIEMGNGQVKVSDRKSVV